MASYRPSREIRVARPCSESWEAMSGDSRTRHCGACDRDVLNTAAMTPAQIEAVLAKPGPLPCMRLVRLEDGALMTAQVMPRMSLLTRAVAAMSAAAMLSSVTALAGKPKPEATLQGKVTGPSGAPALGASVELRLKGHSIASSTVNEKGEFVITVKPGDYEIAAKAKGFDHADLTYVHLSSGVRVLAQPLQLGMVTISVGEPSADEPDVFLKTKKADPPTASTPAPN